MKTFTAPTGRLRRRNSSGNCRNSCASRCRARPRNAFCPNPKPPARRKAEARARADLFKFNYKPREVKEYLDRFVIKQDEAKKVLSVALCDHYHHVRLALEGKESPNYAKQNIILIGPTGVGKTFLIRSAADLIGVPFVKADATKFSETGYVGRRRRGHGARPGAPGRRRRGRARNTASSTSTRSTRSPRRATRPAAMSAGAGVQTNLLKLMEETEVPARSPNDIAGQIQAMMDFTQRGRKAPSTINTKHILFIVSGAFGGLEKIIRKRLREATIGFAAKERPLETAEEVLDARADARLHRVRLRAGVHRPAAGARGLPFAERGRPVPAS